MAFKQVSLEPGFENEGGKFDTSKSASVTKKSYDNSIYLL